MTHRAIITAIGAIFFSCSSLCAQPAVQTEADSVQYHELAELEIVSAPDYVIKEGVAYTPSDQAKEIAQSGISLLRTIAIPSINIDPVSETIQTNLGEKVSIYIDYQPATENDTKGLRPKDVRRVEVLEFPTDPRFHGENHVINFVMRRQESGGYIKASVSQGFVASRTGNLNLYSKTAYRKMIYDIAVGGNHNSCGHNSFDEFSSYDFGNGNLISRSATDLDSRQSTRDGFISFRALYSSPKITISNRIGYSGNWSPEFYNRQQTVYSPEIFPDAETVASYSGQTVSLQWDGNYWFMLPKNFDISITPQFSWQYTKNNSLFEYADNNILTNIRENSRKWTLAVSLNKRFSSHSVGASLYADYQDFNMTYLGTLPAVSHPYYLNWRAEVNGNFNFGNFRLQGRLGLSDNHECFGENYHRQPMGYGFIDATYNVDSRNAVSLILDLANFSYGQAMLNPNLTLKNDIEAIQGNPELNFCYREGIMIDYKWLPFNWMSADIYAKCLYMPEPLTHTFSPTEINGQPYMVSTIVNSGFLRNIDYGLRVSFNLLSNSLFLSGGISGCHDYRKADISWKGNSLRLDASLSYIYRHLYFQGSWRNQQTQINIFNSTKTPSFYNFTIGYTYRELNISASALNPFRSSWRSATIISPAIGQYSSTVVYDSSFHRKFSVDVSYTFGYGKRVDRSNEIGSNSTIGSAILR